MRKTATLFALLITAILVLTACSQPAPDSEPDTQQQADTAPQEPAPEPVQTDTDPDLPEDTYDIAASDMAVPITMRYSIHPEDEGMVESATFDIRNFGDDPIKPVVMFYVGSPLGSDVKRFEYPELPPGYKMIKTEEVNMPVHGMHEPNAIKAELKDGLQNEESLGDDSRTYIAKPSYD